MTTTEYERAAVKEAAEMMDRLIPGWHERIDVTKLAIEIEERCIGGQLGVDFVELTNEWLRAQPKHKALHPFAAVGATPYWREEVLARRLSPVEAPPPPVGVC